ncbi:PREDICTED: metalloproteinase inhibitor 2 [Eufriesea mexicana]|uniref:metalloproteinase inhibitor 2 n=1 Tax=Eufriesea mexicana TaxID=516756 RepID=UPI00083C8732|nr:PREDICTED: metalloproteinase inhibitor 2 [Eufriesea mexicana]XP_017756189.1 PREDICTED: metalloproteinase inhibitor 2 [Eufriesea mexicana]XP_017756190.1 PREDICTED: metalloproteinase inhibitor 2 [Eufriesea mexicana]XP_017756191.1 PREDICTED: metalloproteinase inhibitor 2 [Eufriesea mexicana]
MWQLRFWMYLLLIALSLAPVQRVAACSCMSSHPQTMLCNSDFVALVRVKKATHVNRDEIGYSVKINKIFKVNTKSSYTVLMKNILWTASSEVMCGVHLKVGETYVVSGSANGRDKAHISLCGMSMPWRLVTSRQRKGFRLLYRFGCSCNIYYTPWWTKGAALENTDGKECLWESKPGPEECQRDYGVCMPGQGGCYWVPSVPYKNCIKEYQQKREQQRAREP